MAEVIVETARLVLRGWQAQDCAAFQRICSDPQVMAHLGPPKDMDETAAMIARQIALQNALGLCFWAMTHKQSGALMGFCGVKPGPADTPLAGLMEIGWRMGRQWWGAGYAHEAAQATLDWVWANRDADEVWAMTTQDNLRSRALMARLGMAERPDKAFRHPAHAPDDPLSGHVSYVIARPAAEHVA